MNGQCRCPACNDEPELTEEELDEPNMRADYLRDKEIDDRLTGDAD